MTTIFGFCLAGSVVFHGIGGLYRHREKKIQYKENEMVDKKWSNVSFIIGGLLFFIGMVGLSITE